VTTSQSVSFEELRERVQRAHRGALIRTFALSFATVAIAATVLAFTLRELKHANDQLTLVNNQISAANVAREGAESKLKTAQDALKSADDRVTALQNQVAQLEAELTRSKQLLTEALNLGRYIYKIDWGELKRMFVENGPAVEVLEVVERLKDKVHWGMSNTPSGGYNSPGFAKLVLEQLHRIPADTNLDSLQRDEGPPNAGDIVVYESGYSLFYFQDHEKRKFVVGMTPLGIVSLNYDFGIKRTAVLRTGFPPR
jgi:hypothetical protein